jgi:phosphohistidine phosphatase
MSVPRKLILMRHSEASHDGLSDRARVLTPNGVSRSLEVGQRLQETLSGCDKAVISDATRTRQTAEHVLSGISAKATCFESLLYSANDAGEFIEAVSRNLVSEDHVVLVIGHNPIISTMAGLLTGAYYGFSPSDYLVLTIEADDWLTALKSSGCWTPRP